MFDYIPNAPLIRCTVRPKKILALFLEIGQVENIFYHSPACMVECVSEYTFLSSKNNQQTTTKKQESKKSKRN